MSDKQAWTIFLAVTALVVPSSLYWLFYPPDLTFAALIKLGSSEARLTQEEVLRIDCLLAT